MSLRSQRNLPKKPPKISHNVASSFLNVMLMISIVSFFSPVLSSYLRLNTTSVTTSLQLWRYFTSSLLVENPFLLAVFVCMTIIAQRIEYLMGSRRFAFVLLYTWFPVTVAQALLMTVTGKSTSGPFFLLGMLFPYFTDAPALTQINLLRLVGVCTDDLADWVLCVSTVSPKTVVYLVAVFITYRTHTWLITITALMACVTIVGVPAKRCLSRKGRSVLTLAMNGQGLEVETGGLSDALCEIMSGH